jgi:hypothetical protein
MIPSIPGMGIGQCCVPEFAITAIPKDVADGRAAYVPNDPDMGLKALETSALCTHSVRPSTRSFLIVVSGTQPYHFRIE